MPKKKIVRTSPRPYEYASKQGYFETQRANYEMYEEEREAARKRNADIRRAAEEKVARENARRKTEMSEEEYKKALEYVDLALTSESQNDNNIGKFKQFRDTTQKRYSGSGISVALQSVAGAIADFISGGVNVEKERKAQKERDDFFNQFTPDAFSKALAKYEPKKITTEISGAPQGPALPVDTQAYAIPEKDLAQVQLENTESQKTRTEEYKRLTAPDTTFVQPSLELIDSMNERSKFLADTLEKRNFESRVEAEMYGKEPEGWGIKKWWEDASTRFLINMNEALRDDYAGRIVAEKEMTQRVDEAAQYRRNLMDLSYFENEAKKRSLTKEEKVTLENLKYETAHLKDSYDYVNNMVPDSWLESTRLGINQTISELIDKYLPKDITAPFVNDVDQMRLKLLDLKRIGNEKDLNKFVKEWHLLAKEKEAEWQEGIDANLEDIDRHTAEHKISDYFQYKERNSPGIFGWDVLLYKQPGLLGSSQSAWMKLTVALGLNMGLAALPGGAAGMAARAIGGAAVTLPAAISASESENYAEVAENYKIALKNKLSSIGLLDKFLKGDKNANNVDEAIEHFVLGKYVPADQKIMRAAANATYGANAMFRDDMAATTGDDILDTALQLVPFGIAAKALKASGKSLKGVSKAKNATDAFLTGASFGGPIGGAIWSGTRTAFHEAIDKTVDNTVKMMKTVPYKLLGKSKYKKTAEFFGRNSIPHRVLSPEHYVLYLTFKEYSKELAKRTIKAGISEGGEEGKQYEHGLAFGRGEYRDSEYKSGIFNIETMLNDFTASIKTAYVMAGMLPFIPATTNDRDLIENIEGGILGGMFLTGAQVLAAQTPSMISQMKINHFVTKQALYEKMLQRDAYEKYKLYAKKAGDAGVILKMNAAFNMYELAIRDNQDETATLPSLEMINEQRKRFNLITQLADTPFMQEAAKSMGIKPNGFGRRAGSTIGVMNNYTDEYRRFVGLVGILQDASQESQDNYNSTLSKLNALISKQNTPYSLDGNDVVKDAINRATNEVVKEKVDPIANGEQEISGLALLDIKNREFRSNIELFTNIAVLKQLVAEVDEAISQNKNVPGATRDLKFVRNRLKQELDRNMNRIVKDRQKDVLENIDKMLYGVEDLDLIKTLARQKMMLGAELDYHLAVLGGVLGEYGKPEVGSEEASKNLPYSDFNANTLIKLLEDSLEEDFKIQENIEQDWLDNFNVRSRLSMEDEQKKLEEWRSKMQKKAEERKAAAESSKKTTKKEDNSLVIEDENKEEVKVPESTYGAEELLPEVEKPTGTPADNMLPTRTLSDPQRKAIEALATKYEADKSRMEVVDLSTGEVSVDRTGHDYFILDENGHVRMFGRVHSYLDPLYARNPEETAAHDFKVKELRDLWNAGLKDKFREKALEYEQKFEAEFKDYPGFNKVNVGRYLDYLTDNEDEIEDIIEAIADLTSHIPADASVIIGNVIDNACRIFFKTGELNYEEVSKYMPSEVYDDFVRQLQRIKEQYDDLGWELIAEPHYFFSTFYDNRTGRTRRVAGETDMIAVDREGNYHIIDFKTSKNRFHDQYGPGGERLRNPFTDLKSDEALNDKRILQRSTKEFYTDQQSMYTLMLLDNLADAVVSSRELLPFVVGYKKEYVENITSLGPSTSSRILEGELVITSIKNEIEALDDEHNFIMEEGGDKVIMNVQRILLEMSLTVAERFLDRNNKLQILDRMQAVVDTNPFDFFYNLDDADRSKLSAATIDAILRLEDEYKEVIKLISKGTFSSNTDQFSIISRGEKVIAQAELLRMLTEAEIAQKEVEESAKQDAGSAPKQPAVTDQKVELIQEDPEITRRKLTYQQFVDNLILLLQLSEDVQNGKYNNADGTLNGVAVTNANLLISNINGLLALYESEFPIEQVNLFHRLNEFFNQSLIVQHVETEPSIVDSNTVDKIQEDWKSITTTWKDTLDDSIGIEQAVSEDGSKLLDVTGDPEFITDAIFELTMKKAKGYDRIHVIVHYKGKTYTPVAISNANTVQGRGFYNAVRLAVAKNPGKRIIIRNTAVTRSNGRIRRVERGSLVLQGIVNDLNYYEISFNSTQTKFGITKKSTDPITNEPVTRVYAPGESETQKRELFVWRGEGTPEGGTLVMMVEPIRNETHAEKSRIPLIINESSFTEDDAQLVVDILTMQTVGDVQNITPLQALNREYIENENGLFVRKGLTNMQVLSLLIPYGPSRTPGETRPFLSFSADPNIEPSSLGKIYLHGRLKGDPIGLAPREFDITTAEGRLALKQFLVQNVNVHIDEDVMRSRILRASSQNDTPFSGLGKVIHSEYGQKTLKAGKAILFGKSRIKFDAKDIQNPNNPSDALGASGLAWYAKCGFIQSEFGGFENTLLKFDDSVMPEVEKEIPTMPKAESAELANLGQNEKILSGNSIDVNEKDDVLDDTYDNSAEVGYDDDVWNKIVKTSRMDFDEVEARENLKHILGDKVPVTIMDAFIDTMVSGGHVVGRTYADTILLSRMGERGIEWHEAFHHILEILTNERLKDHIYKTYRKLINDQEASDHQIGEALADQFMMYMMDRPSVNIKGIKGVLLAVKDWYNLYKKIGSFQLFAYYTAINFGVYKKITPNPERAAKFRRMYPEGRNMTIGKTGFKHILNEHMYKEFKKTLVLLLLLAQNIDPAGRNIQDLQVDDKIIRRSKIFKSLMLSDEELRSQGIKRAAKLAPLESRLALQELLDNWDEISGDVASAISQFSTDYITRYESEQEEDADGGEAASASIAEHIRASYEFSQFSRTSSKVRFFFSRIPKSRYVDGKLVQELNEFGLPTYYDAKYIFNYVLNECHAINSKLDLIDSLNELGKNDPMFKLLAQRIQNLSNSAKTNVNDLQLLTQIYNSIKTAKNAFVVGKSVQNGDYFSVVIQSTDADHNAQKYKKEWSKLFASGASLFVEVGEDGKLRMKNGYTANIFTNLAQRLLNIADCFSDAENPVLIVDGKRIKFDKTDSRHVEAAKRNFIKALLSLGIQFDYDLLNFILSRKPYGDTGFVGMQKLLHQQGVNDIAPFIRLLTQLNYKGQLNIDGDGKFTYVDAKGNSSTRPVNSIFVGSGAGFISMLSTAKYNYRTAHDQLLVLATHGNKYYTMSENNVINDITDIINRAALGQEEEIIEESKMDVYNFYQPQDPNMIGLAPAIGSIIHKKINQDKESRQEDPNYSPDPVQVVTLAGFKTDERGDQGNDYAEISLREDYVTKSAILLDGGLLFPTMSDKKTWVYLKGIEIPGIDHSHAYSAQTLNTLDQLGFFTQLDSVVEQFLEYAQTEHMSVKRTLEQVKNLSEEEKVKNFHKATVKIKKGDKEIKISTIQGARFTSMLGVYDYVVEDGKTVRKFIEFNRVLDEKGNVLNEEDNLKLAEEHFFLPLPKRDDAGNILVDANGQPFMETAEECADRQKRQIAEVLLHQLIEELRYIEQIGLIKRRATNATSSLLSYQNIGLDNVKIESLARALASQLGLEWQKMTKEQHAQYMSLGIAALVNDTMVKHIMSLQEVERIYSGNPSFYKFGYDNNGHLVDRTVDQLKRFGGLVSTGQPNDLEQDVPTTYTAAEVDNEMVQAANIDSLHDLMVEGQIRSTYLRQLLDENNVSIEDEENAKKYADIADNTPLDEVRKALDPTALKIAERIAEKKANSFRMGEHNGKKYDGIDVADGGAYVTDEMAENMLKMVGAYDEQVLKAFEILRDPSKVHSIREKAEAYNQVWTTVIGTQKYTAYGFRHQNGLQVPYYNKMALFPLFKCMCTGNMAKIYEKMKHDRIDMLMVNSAVKLGSLGSKAIKSWDNFETDFHFNPYTLRFSYLRKQFNTDPKEEELMNVGTQMKKVAMSAIMPGREYTTLDGRTMSAMAIRDDIMNSINSMSDMGLEAIRKEFFTDGELDVEKFSKFLTEELSGRGAGREMLDAVSVIDENSEGISDEQRERIKRTGKKELKVPLVALSNMNWIQSIIVSRVNSKVVDTSTPGAAFIQRSVWAMEGATSVINDENLPEDINGGNDLQMVNEEGSMDCVLSIDFFDHLLPKKVVGYKMKDGEFVLNKQGNRIPIYLKLSFNEAKQYLIDNGIIGPKAHANMVGYRIPTQAISSIHALRCVDVIPVVRDTIILPKEFTKITGSDFDIDKIFLSMKAYKKDGKNLTDKFEETDIEHHQNKLVDDYIALLCDTVEDENGNKTTRSMHMLHASIDNDTSLIEDVISDIEESSRKKTLMAYDAYTLRHQCRAKDDFITGKVGIGPYALNNNSQVLTTLYEVEFAEDEKSIMTRLKLNSLHRQADRDGESIMSWLSALINIHVDVAKDPKHNKLNINGYTHNLVNLLIRTGFGKSTFYFTTQPIMKELAVVSNNASGKFMQEKGLSQSKLKKLAEQLYIMRVAAANGIKGRAFGSVMHNWEKKMHDRQIGINSAIDWLLSKEGIEVLRLISKQGLDMSSNKQFRIDCLWDGKPHSEMLSVFDILMLVYRAFKQFSPYAEALSNLVKYSKIDTKKHGKTLLEQKQYMQGYNAMFGKNSQDSSRLLFKTDGLDRLRDKTYIGKMTNNAISVFSDIMGSLLLQGTDKFIGYDGLVDHVLSTIGRFGSTDQQLLRQVVNSILGKKKSDFFNKYAKDNGIDMKSLVDGNNTIFNRLCKIKSEIICTEKYKYLRDLNGNIRNYMLQTLVAGYTRDFEVSKSAPYGTMNDDYKHVKFVNTLSFIDDESIDQDEFILAWDDLLNDSRFPELQEFARDLIVYAFVTSADSGGRYDLMKFVPNAWKIKSGYVDEMVRLLDRFNSNLVSLDTLLSKEDIEDIVLNNWYDDNFVHEVTTNDIREFFSKVKLPDGSIKSTKFPTIIGLGENVTDSEYIKIKRPNIGDVESQRNYTLYKRVGYGEHTRVFEIEENGKVVQKKEVTTYPIYVAVDPRGNKFREGLIYSYGRNDSSKESLLNMVLDALVNQLVIQRGIKVENTEQAFKELSKIFHEIEPTVADALRTMYGSSIQEVVDEYNKVEYALEDAMKNAPVEAPSPVPFPNYDEPTTPPATSQQAEEQGLGVFEMPKEQSLNPTTVNSTLLEDGKEYDADYVLNVYKNTFALLHKPYFKLADTVFTRAKELGIKFKINKSLGDSGVYHKDTNVVEYNVPENQNHNTLLHEAIHAVVSYQITLARTNPELLSKEELAAIEELNFVYELMKDKLLSKEPMARSVELLDEENYGLTSLDEFVAELSSPVFRAKIQDFDKSYGKEIFKKLVDAIFKILGINKEYISAEKTVYNSLRTLLENTNSETFQKANRYYMFRRSLENSENYVSLSVPFDLEELFLAALDEKSKGRTIIFDKSKWNEIFSERMWNLIQPGRIMYINVGRGRVLAKIESSPIENGGKYNIKYSAINPSEYMNLQIEDGIIYDLKQPIYKDTIKLKSAVYGAFVNSRLSGGIGIDDVYIGILTKSKSNGKYIIVRPKDLQNKSAVEEVLSKLELDSNMSIQFIERGNEFLISRDVYRMSQEQDTNFTSYNDFSQYNLEYDFNGEMIRMMQEDPELVEDYIFKLGREKMEECGII